MADQRPAISAARYGVVHRMEVRQMSPHQMSPRFATIYAEGISPYVPVADDRITEAGDARITEAGDSRITE